MHGRMGWRWGCCWLVLAAATASGQEAESPADRSETEPKLVSAGEAPARQLVYKFAAGQFADYEVVHSTNIQAQFQGIKETVRNDSQTWKNFRVVGVDGQGVATLEPLIKRVKMSATSGSNDPVSYDSQDGGAPPTQFRDIQETVGRPIARVAVTPNGELKKITLLAGAPAHLTEAAAKTDPRLNFLFVLPREPVGVGAVWRTKFQAPVHVGQKLMQQVWLQKQCQLTKFDGPVAVIAVKTSVLTPVGNPEVQAQLMQRLLNGTVEFDVERGLVVSQKMSINESVVGPFGQDSAMQVASETRERLLPGAVGVQPAALRDAATTK